MSSSQRRERVISNRMLLAVRDCMLDLQLDWTEAAETVGFAPEAADEPEGTMAIGQLSALFDYLVDASGDDAVGLKIGFSIPIGVTGAFDYIALSSASIRAALQSWQRFHHVPTNAIGLRFDENAVSGSLRWELPDFEGPRAQIIGLVMGYAISRLRHMMCDSNAMPRVELSHERPVRIADYERILGPDLRFDQPVDRLSFPSDWLDRVPPKRDPMLCGLIEEMAASALREVELAADALFLVNRYVTEGLERGELSLDRIAARMSMSARSLQRLLEENGTSFRRVSERIRRETAQRLLAESVLPLREIARRTGFSDQTALSRAVKTWFGLSPHEMRRGKGAGKSG
jgi:AraC-like DNA-binding protein